MYNHKAAEFEIERLQNNNSQLRTDRKALIRALRELQSDCVNKDASQVLDGDAFIQSRQLLALMNISGS
ncbi:coil containing protein [Vibrio phage 1.127.O._10N.286.52.E12]|nr:coil containing protein [Vibrio phage 1.127.O._10N.286.52.E12]